MEWQTILIFFSITLGLGYSLSLLIKPKPWIDTVLLSLVLGLVVWPLAIFIFRVLHIPLDVRWLLVLAALGPAFGIWKMRVPNGDVPWQRYAMIGIVVIASFLLMWMMFVGATKYPWLEDDDPWGHATGAHYVATEKTTATDFEFTRYLEPYPPYYTAIMGVLHQTSLDLRWVLKFFNALIVGLSLIAAFYAFEALLKSPGRAAVGALILGMLPAYMSHFIWSQTIAIPVLLMGIWALASLDGPKKKDKGWHKDGILWLGTIVIGSATIIQPSAAVIAAAIYIIYTAVRVGVTWHEKRLLDLRATTALIAGGLLSLIVWSYYAIVYGLEEFMSHVAVSPQMFTSGQLDTSGGQIYSLSEIIFAPVSSKIDQATGLGWFVSLLVLVGIILLIVNWKRLLTLKHHHWLFVLILFAFTLLGVQGNALPVKLFPHRFWVFLAIPVAILAAEAIFAIAKQAKHKHVHLALLIGLTFLALFTNYEARLSVQQAQWPPGVMWASQGELSGYVKLPEKLPEQSRVMTLCTTPDRVIGFNMDAEAWDPDLRPLWNNLSRFSGQEIVDMLSMKGYEYVTLDAKCAQRYGPNVTTRIVEELSSTQRLMPVYQEQGFLLARIA